jgi:hypothetical protein
MKKGALAKGRPFSICLAYAAVGLALVYAVHAPLLYAFHIGWWVVLP